jgi:hypothetical protein
MMTEGMHQLDHDFRHQKEEKRRKYLTIMKVVEQS